MSFILKSLNDNSVFYFVLKYEAIFFDIVLPSLAEHWRSTLPILGSLIPIILFQFRVEPSGMAFDLVLDLPLTIGTIPIASAYHPFQQPGASAPPAPWMPDYSSTQQGKTHLSTS